MSAIYSGKRSKTMGLTIAICGSGEMVEMATSQNATPELVHVQRGQLSSSIQFYASQILPLVATTLSRVADVKSRLNNVCYNI
jgi:hypothetical protein